MGRISSHLTSEETLREVSVCVLYMELHFCCRSDDKGSSLQAMHKYGKVKSFRLVKHIGKGFAIALLYDLTSVGLYTYCLSITVLIIHYVVTFCLVRVLHEDMLLWSMSLRRSCVVLTRY